MFAASALRGLRFFQVIYFWWSQKSVFFSDKVIAQKIFQHLKFLLLLIHRSFEWSGWIGEEELGNCWDPLFMPTDRLVNLDWNPDSFMQHNNLLFECLFDLYDWRGYHKIWNGHWYPKVDVPLRLLIVVEIKLSDLIIKTRFYRVDTATRIP